MILMKKRLSSHQTLWPLALVSGLFLCGISLCAQSAAEREMEKYFEKTAAIVGDRVSHKTEPFAFAKAVPALSNAAGGFAAEPAFVTTFDTGWENEKGKPWQIATWTQNGTKMSRERAKTDADGNLVLTVEAGEPYRGGSLQTTREFGYGRWVARVKPTSVPGILNSIFTKDWDDLTTPESNSDGNKGEVDIEFLTYTFKENAGEVHLAIHLENHGPLWHIDIPVDFNPSDEFRVWGFDILPDRIVWHVDGKILWAWKYTDEYRIEPDYEFFFNAWTKDTWIQGPPSERGQYQIDWLKFYPYTGD